MSLVPAPTALDPVMRALAERMPGMSEAGLQAMEPGALLSAFRAVPMPVGDDASVSVDDLAVPTRHGSVRVRRYRPAGDDLPALINLHGGGWVGGSLEQDHARCVALAKNAALVAFSVEYALSPEHAFPIAQEQCEDVVDWIRSAPPTGVDADTIALCGSSSGGAIAACLAHKRARDVAALLLTYPVCDSTVDYPSCETFGQGYLLTADMMRWFWRQYLGARPADIPPGAAPLHAKELSSLPPTMIVTAECDILRDEAELFARRLADAGVEVALHRMAGMLHGFMSLAPVHPATIEALDLASSFLRRTLGRPGTSTQVSTSSGR